MKRVKSLNDLEKSLVLLKASASATRKQFELREKWFNEKPESWKSSSDGQVWQVLLFHVAQLLEDIEQIKAINHFTIRPGNLRVYNDFISKMKVITVS